MKISETGGRNAQSLNLGVNQSMDPESKSLQNQIANAQSQLQSLSANREMSDEEKAEKRQEIQKQIVELNNQLRQHQIELRREQQEKKTSGEDMLGGEQKTAPVKESSQPAGISSASMQAIISADSAAEQASRQGNVSLELKGRVRVLEGELKLDEGRGVATDAKTGELESLENKVTATSGAQVNILNYAVQKMKRAIREENQKDSTSGDGKKKGAQESDKALSVFADQSKTDAYKRGKIFSDMDIHI